VYEAVLTPVLDTTDREVTAFTDKQQDFETAGMIQERNMLSIHRCASLDAILAGSMFSFLGKNKIDLSVTSQWIPRHT
jgi:hypothetical protein